MLMKARIEGFGQQRQPLWDRSEEFLGHHLPRFDAKEEVEEPPSQCLTCSEGALTSYHALRNHKEAWCHLLPRSTICRTRAWHIQRQGR
eukprot:502993-Amphidinium_carterae.1